MKNFAHLKADSPFYDLFPNGLCPIVNILVPSRVELIGSDETAVYMVDVEKIGYARLLLIAQRLASSAGGINPTVVFDEIKEHGLPLRLSQCAGISTDVPFFL